MRYSKRIFFYTLFHFAFFTAYSQIVEYSPFPVDTAKWSHVMTQQGYESSFPPTRRGWDYYLMGDTVINGLEYGKVYYKYVYKHKGTSYTSPDPYGGFIRSPLCLVGGIREDSTKRIFFLSLVRPESNYDNAFNFLLPGNEYLLYDFNLDIGDSLDWLPFGYSNKVVNIDTVEVFENDFRKRYTFYYGSNTDVIDNYWISGIGSSLGLLGSYNSPTENDYDPKLICFNDKINLALINEDPKMEEYNNCEFYFDQYLPQEEVLEDTTTIEFNIYPNPANDFINIECNLNTQFDFKIFNIQSQLIFQEHSSLKKTVYPLQNLLPGLYIIYIKIDGKEIIDKIIKLP